jgi:hypothetical protein
MSHSIQESCPEERASLLHIRNTQTLLETGGLSAALESDRQDSSPEQAILLPSLLHRLRVGFPHLPPA